MLYKLPKQKPRLNEDDLLFLVVGFALIFIKIGLGIAFLIN